MRPRAFYHSLRFKIEVALFLALLVILALFSYLHYADVRTVMMENLALSALNMGEIIEGSLQRAMRMNDFSAVQQIVDDIAKEEGVEDLLLLDKEGSVVIAADHDVVAAEIDMSDVTCQACHQYSAASRNESVILVGSQGDRVFRNVNGIENRSECWACHDSDESLSGVLITDMSMEQIDRQLAALRNSSLIWASGSIILVMVAIDIMLGRMVIRRLTKFLHAITQISSGNLSERVSVGDSDELGQLASVFNRMAVGLQERARLEERVRERTEELHEQAERLTTLNAIAVTVGQSLDLEEILNNALDKLLELTELSAGWLGLRNLHGDGFGLVICRGVSEEITRAHLNGVETQGTCAAVLGKGRSRILATDEPTCAAAEFLRESGFTFRVCVPIQSKDRVLGVMSMIGEAAQGTGTMADTTLDMLTAIGSQIGIAVENASLYQELSQKEALRKRLLGRLLTAQEEERKRIARELHDDTSQALTSLLVKLKVMDEADSLEAVRAQVDDLREDVARTLDEVHDLSLGLRSAVLDDLGLTAALRQYLKGYQREFQLLVDLQALGGEEFDLSSQVESALYQIIQEALINVARHAQCKRISIVLQRRDATMIAIVEDDGVGFDVTQVMGSRPEKRNLGLYGMQERASLVGGSVTIESTPGVGTTVFVEMPLGQRDEGDG
jgi:nitrate/nitrite-specific signal transduction histidine kinase